MKCSLCSCDFNAAESKSSCSGCPMNKSCRLIRCPNCGYEFPEEPDWLKKITNIFKGKKDGTIDT